jgi:hypothetical protein
MADISVSKIARQTDGEGMSIQFGTKSKRTIGHIVFRRPAKGPLEVVNGTLFAPSFDLPERPSAKEALAALYQQQDEFTRSMLGDAVTIDRSGKRRVVISTQAGLTPSATLGQGATWEAALKEAMMLAGIFQAALQVLAAREKRPLVVAAWRLSQPGRESFELTPDVTVDNREVKQLDPATGDEEVLVSPFYVLGG